MTTSEAPNPSAEAKTVSTSPTFLAIRDAALKCFAESGYESTTMRQIASEVGIRVGSLYSHFPSKESILWLICESAMIDLIANIEDSDVLEGDARARLSAYVARHVQFHIDHSDECVVVNDSMRNLSSESYKSAASLRHTYEYQLRLILQQGVDDGTFGRLVNIRLASYGILAMGMHVARWYRPDGTLTRDDIVDGHVMIALDIVQSRKY